MIDFKNSEFLKLKPVNDTTYASMIIPMFVPSEEIINDKLCAYNFGYESLEEFAKYTLV